MKRNSFLMNISSWDHGRQLQCAITVRHSAFKYNFKLHTCTTADSSYIDSLVSQTSARQQIWSTFAVSHHLVYKGVQWCTLYTGVQVNSWGECWNPTEAGGRHDNFNHHRDIDKDDELF